jgi:hypothetical protein
VRTEGFPTKPYLVYYHQQLSRLSTPASAIQHHHGIHLQPCYDYPISYTPYQLKLSIWIHLKYLDTIASCLVFFGLLVNLISSTFHSHLNSTDDLNTTAMPPQRSARPIQRLQTLAKPSAPSPKIKRPGSVVRSVRSLVCPTPSCGGSGAAIIDDGDKKVCTKCGTVLSESNIVSEVQFGESASGAAVVQGSYVGADQSHARSLGGAFKRAGGMESREITDANGEST